MPMYVIVQDCSRIMARVISYSELKNYLANNGLTHTRGRPYHPQTQGKIERYHRSMKNILLLDNYYSLDNLKAQIADFVEYYNNERYHESLNNVTPADVYTGRNVRIIEERQRIKERTIKLRKQNYKKTIAREQTLVKLSTTDVRIV